MKVKTTDLTGSALETLILGLACRYLSHNSDNPEPEFCPTDWEVKRFIEAVVALTVPTKEEAE